MASITTLLHIPPNTKPLVSPLIQQTLLQHLVLLQHTVLSSHRLPELSNVVRQVNDLAHHIQLSAFALTDEGSLISEYNLVLKNPSAMKDADTINIYLFSEAVVRLLRPMGMKRQIWILRLLLDVGSTPPFLHVLLY